MSNLEWDVYMAILRDRSDDPSVWARNKLQQMADRIHALTAERDEARRDADRWQDDALRLLKERNDAMEERDAARREVCYASTQPPRECAADRGWDCFDRKDFCEKL